MLSFILILISSLFFSGIIILTKSITSGRKGPWIFQPLKDIWRLIKKGSVFSETSSIIFRIAPTIYFASVLMAIMVIPFGNEKGIISFQGDFVFFAYVIAIGKFFMVVSALDTGSPFEGMGAAREALFSMLVEPAFFLLMGSFALLTGHTSMHELFSGILVNSVLFYTLVPMAIFVLVIITMVENSRMPFDDPKTHLELTMVHEVIILDNSGFDLGLIMQAVNLKFSMYAALIACFFISRMEWYFAIPVFLGVQFLFAVTVGLLESFSARFRMNHNAQFIFTLASVTLLLFFGVLIATGKFM